MLGVVARASARIAQLGVGGEHRGQAGRGDGCVSGVGVQVANQCPVGRGDLGPRRVTGDAEHLVRVIGPE